MKGKSGATKGGNKLCHFIVADVYYLSDGRIKAAPAVLPPRADVLGVWGPQTPGAPACFPCLEASLRVLGCLSLSRAVWVPHWARPVTPNAGLVGWGKAPVSVRSMPQVWLSGESKEITSLTVPHHGEDKGLYVFHSVKWKSCTTVQRGTTHLLCWAMSFSSLGMGSPGERMASLCCQYAEWWQWGILPEGVSTMAQCPLLCPTAPGQPWQQGSLSLASVSQYPYLILLCSGSVRSANSGDYSVWVGTRKVPTTAEST